VVSISDTILSVAGEFTFARNQRRLRRKLPVERKKNGDENDAPGSPAKVTVARTSTKVPDDLVGLARRKEQLRSGNTTRPKEFISNSDKSRTTLFSSNPCRYFDGET